MPGLDDVAGLTVVRVDPQATVERLWGGAAGAVGAVVPQLTLPPASSVVPLPGHGRARPVRRAGAGRRRPRRASTPARSRRRPRSSALPSTLRWWLDQLLPPGMRALGAVRTAAVAAGAAQRGPVDAALAAVPVVEGLLARDRLADPPTAVCLVAAPRAGVAARPARGGDRRWRLHGLRPGAVLARVLPAGRRGRVGGAARRRAGRRPGRPRRGRHRPPGARGAPSPPADADALAGLLDGFEPPGGRPPATPARRAPRRRLAADRAAALRRAGRGAT